MTDTFDDPLAPWNIIETQKLWSNWREFTKVVCAPIVDIEDNRSEVVQEAMRRYRLVCPYSVAVMLYIALNTVERLEAEAMGEDL
jgi:hypothetical protein